MSSLSGALYQAVTGAPTLVQFQDYAGNTIVQFDATVNETYSSEAELTRFPVEDGSTISDHIVRSPRSIDMTGVVSDTPIGGRDQLLAEAATVAATATLPPIGIIAAAVAYATWRAHVGTESPSQAAYAQLLALQIGNPTASPPTSPEPFRVVTKLGIFENMMISKLSVPREASTGGALIFNLTVAQVEVVLPQTISVTQVDVPALAAAKSVAGEQQISEQEREFERLRIIGAATTRKAFGK